MAGQIPPGGLISFEDLNSKSQNLSSICDALLSGNTCAAAEIASNNYPFAPASLSARNYTESEGTAVFIRDGFIERYSGERLVFPGALRLISRLLPAQFPFHRNWKMTETHMMYWELYPTIDHVIPVGRGGADKDENRVTTSMLRNCAKANWSLEELGWHLDPELALEQTTRSTPLFSRI